MATIDFEFSTNGHVIVPGDGFASVNQQPTISTAWAAGGTRSCDCSTTASGAPNVGVSEGTRTVGWEVAAFRLVGRPPSNQIIMQGMGGASAFASVLWQVRVLTDGTVQFRDGLSAKWSSTGTLPNTTADYRLAVLINGTTVRVKVYDSANSATTLFDSGNVAGAYSGGAWDGVRYGQISAMVWGLFVDEINRVATTTEPGPAVTPPTVDAGADQTIQDTHTATIDATVTGTTGTPVYAWSVLSGPSTSSGQFSTTSAVDTAFTPAGGAGTYVLQLAVTDGSGVTTDTTTVTVTALQTSDGIAAVLLSTGWTANTGTVSDALTDDDPDTYITSSDNPTSLDLRYRMRGIIAPTGDYKHTLQMLGRSGGSGTVDVSLYRSDGTTLAKKITGVTAPTTAADTVVTFAAADITSVTTADWNAGVVILVEATAS